jgi:pyrrolysine biosynthesis protein PylD
MADDNRYISINVKTGRIGDNNIATARGYVTALEKMAGSLENKDVLVIGCGIVGKLAIDALQETGAAITLYDKNEVRLKEINCDIPVLKNINEIKNFNYILDATNGGGWLHKEMLAENVMIATPGVPLSLDAETYFSMQERIIHDYLQIGTAVMLGLVM